MPTRVHLKPDSTHFLNKCRDAFPDGIPVTSSHPTDEFDFIFSDWDRLSLPSKLYQVFIDLTIDFSFEGLGIALKPWSLKFSPHKRQLFYLLDSKALSTHQYQLARKAYFLFSQEAIDNLNAQLQANEGPDAYTFTPQSFSHLLSTVANPNDPLHCALIKLPDIFSILHT